MRYRQVSPAEGPYCHQHSYRWWRVALLACFIGKQQSHHTHHSLHDVTFNPIRAGLSCWPNQYTQKPIIPYPSTRLCNDKKQEGGSCLLLVPPSLQHCYYYHYYLIRHSSIMAGDCSGCCSKLPKGPGSGSCSTFLRGDVMLDRLIEKKQGDRVAW